MCTITCMLCVFVSTYTCLCSHAHAHAHAHKHTHTHSVAYVSRSGGMSNELNNIISRSTNGVYEGVAIGGDR